MNDSDSAQKLKELNSDLNEILTDVESNKQIETDDSAMVGAQVSALLNSQDINLSETQKEKLANSFKKVMDDQYGGNDKKTKKRKKTKKKKTKKEKTKKRKKTKKKRYKKKR